MDSDMDFVSMYNSVSDDWKKLMRKLLIVLSVILMGFNVTACNASSKAKASNVPSIFNNLSKYKLVNRKDYVIGLTPGPVWTYFFQTDNKYKLTCSMGTVGRNPTRQVTCFGYMPDKNKAATGSIDLHPRQSYQSIAFDYNRADIVNDSETVSDTIVHKSTNVGHKSAKVLPVGSKMFIPKSLSDEEFKKEHEDSQLPSNLDATCVVFDENQAGCINSDKHGFLVTTDDVKLF